MVSSIDEDDALQTARGPRADGTSVGSNGMVCALDVDGSPEEIENAGADMGLAGGGIGTYAYCTIRARFAPSS